MPEPTIPAGSNRGEEDMDSWKAQQLGRELEAVQCCRVPEFLCRHFVKATKNLKSTELRCTITEPGKVRSIELELPDDRLSVMEHELPGESLRFALLRKQLQSELQQVTTRLQVVEARLGSHTVKQAAAPTGETKVVHDYSLPFDTATLTLEVHDANQADAEDASGRRRVQEFTEVSFEESAWSIPLVAGLIDVGIVDTMFASALVLLNLLMQSAFSIILLTPAFMGDEFESKIQSAQLWRTSVAHDERYMDLAGTSLVTRVCNGDGSVILSTVQATLVEHVNSFLGMEKDEFTLPAFRPGILLCMLCIVLWTLCILKEFRRIWVQLEAAARIPKALATSFGENTFEAMSWGRFCLLLLTYACRTVIASVLLVAGILWLARTTSISELMLNAVALNAILDVDEFLFVGMTPIKIQHAIQNLEPIQVKYSRRRSECESMVHFMGLVILVSSTYFFQLAPLTDAMLDLKNELCGGNQSFVVGFNPDTQLTHALVTPTALEIGRNLTLSELGVQAHKATSPETTPGQIPTYLIFSTDKNTFSIENSRSIEVESSMIPFCTETSILNPDGLYHGDLTLRAFTMVLVRNAAASVGLPDARSCEEMRGMCNGVESRLLRMVCGETCGCTDPYSSAWYKVAAHGCQPTCLQLAQASLSGGSCEDAANDEVWQAFWRIYPEAVSHYFSADVTQTILWPAASQTINAMLRDGCAALMQFPTDVMTTAEWFALLRKQLQSELQQVVEARLNHAGSHTVKAAAPADETKVVHDYSLPLDTATLTSRRVQEFTEVSFEESAWSIPLLAGLIDVGLFDTMFASALVLLNLLMQSAFSIILLTPAFMGDEFESKIQSAQSWRTSVAHDERYMDLAGTSL
ncbi:unnamed protein product, partial [Symbiodinium microadriaticum]